MQNVVQIIVIYGIPLVGILVCTMGGAWCYRRAKAQRRGLIVTALLYFVATALPVGLSMLSIMLGSYLGSKHHIYLLWGEATWGIFIIMPFYIIFAIITNLVLWLLLAILKWRRRVRP